MMVQLMKWLESCGIATHILLLGSGPLVVLLGIIHIILASRKSFILLCLALALTLGAGLFMTSIFRSRVADAVSMARPEQHLGLAVAGYSEANRPLQLAFVIVLAGLLPYSVGEIRRRHRSAS